MLSGIFRALSRRSGKLQRSVVKRLLIEPKFKAVPDNAVILEIGGGYNPRYVKARHPNAYHLDHCSTEELKAKYRADPSVAHLINNIQPVDFIFSGSPIETLIPEVLKFDLIYGSHVLEHQVDLVGHLNSLEKLLKPGGRVIEMIPDLRTCFDALRYPSVTSDALLAYFRRAPVHQGKQVFDGTSRVIDKNPGYRIWMADLDGVHFTGSLKRAYEAMRTAELPGQPYIDTHAWTFTPKTFRLLMIELRLLGLTRLAPTYVSQQYGNQFCAVLELAEKAGDGLSVAEIARLEGERLALCKAVRVHM